MSSVAEFTFKPDESGTASANLLAFISHCKYKLQAFGNVTWDATRWDISDTIKRRARETDVHLNWTDIDSKKGFQAHAKNRPFAQPFADFAKSFIRYRYAHKPTTAIDGPPLSALRALERALLDVTKTCDVRLTDAGVLNRAAELARAKWPGSCHQVGGFLEEIGSLLKEKRLAERIILWKNPLPQPRDRSVNRVGPEADKLRARRLPSDSVMRAVATAFNEATEPRDVVTTSAAALLACAPDRVSEVLNLRRDAEVTASLDGKPSYGLRWFPSKGAEPMIKAIPRVMEDVAKKAMARLLSATLKGHELAVWYSRHPDQLYLPPALAHLRTREYLTLNEVTELLGYASPTISAQLLGRRAPHIIVKQTDGSVKVSYAGFQKHVLSQLPKGFPVMDARSGLRYEDALFVVPQRFFKSGKPSQVMFASVTSDQLARALGNVSDDGEASTFSRLDLKDDDGNYFRIRTHQFRHFLNTLARKGGMSELDIALWSGRKDVRSNGSYDNLTADESLAMARAVTRTTSDSLVEFVVRDPVSRTAFDVLRIKTGHATEYGVCVHDYAMSPCLKHRDCINCEEQECVKGDEASNERIRAALKITEALHKKAVEALGDDRNGAGRWEEHHYRTLQRLRGLVAILDDPSVPKGSLIRLARSGEHTRLGMALEEYRSLTQGEREAKIEAIRLFHSKRAQAPQTPERDS